MFSAGLMPGLLETKGYALAVLGIAASVHGLPADDHAQAVHTRVEPSRVIHETRPRFTMATEDVGQAGAPDPRCSAPRPATPRSARSAMAVPEQSLGRTGTWPDRGDSAAGPGVHV